MFIFWTTELSLSQIPLIEHRRSSKRLSNLTRKARVRSLVIWIFCEYTSFPSFSITSRTSHQSMLLSLAHQYGTLISDRYGISFGAPSWLLPRYFLFMDIPNSQFLPPTNLVERLPPSSRTRDRSRSGIGNRSGISTVVKRSSLRKVW